MASAPTAPAQKIVWARDGNAYPDAPAGAAPLVSIVVPTLNERANIEPLVEALRRALGEMAWEVIFVDDNSRDGTAEEAKRIARQDPRVRCIRRIGRRGLACRKCWLFCKRAARIW